MEGLGWEAMAAIGAALALGGVLKGATGAGAPIVAVPVIAAFASVQAAILVMVVPNLVTNGWQAWRMRRAVPGRATVWLFAGGGALGATLGTALLILVPERWLLLAVALAVLGYVGLRVAVPELALSPRAARLLALPAGIGGGALQGAAGISAPVSMSFVNAMRLEREAFIAVISTFFAVMTVVQVGALAAAGLFGWRTTLWGVAACAVVVATVPLGGWLARFLSAKAFDRLVLGMLSLLALRLGWQALAG